MASWVAYLADCIGASSQDIDDLISLVNDLWSWTQNQLHALSTCHSKRKWAVFDVYYTVCVDFPFTDIFQSYSRSWIIFTTLNKRNFLRQCLPKLLRNFRDEQLSSVFCHAHWVLSHHPAKPVFLCNWPRLSPKSLLA